MIDELRTACISLFGTTGIAASEIADIEKRLSVKLASDFKQILLFCGGGGLGIHEFSEWTTRSAENFVTHSLFLRSCFPLNKNQICLGESCESLFFLNCSNSKQGDHVFWIADHDTHLMESDIFPVELAIDYWPNSIEFLKYIVNDAVNSGGAPWEAL